MTLYPGTCSLCGITARVLFVAHRWTLCPECVRALAAPIAAIAATLPPETPAK